MRIGVIADVHGNHVALESVLEELRPIVDRILFLGDLCGYYPFVERCAALLEGFDVEGVLGNHDRALLDCLEQSRLPNRAYTQRYGSALERSLSKISRETIEFLEGLAEARSVHVDGITLALFHGAPWDRLEGRVYPDFQDWERFEGDVDVVLLGHTHYPFVHRRPGQLIANPGSVGQPRDVGSQASYAVLKTPDVELTHGRKGFDPREIMEDARRHDPDMPYLREIFLRDRSS